MIGLMQERPPYVRFEVQTVEVRDNLGGVQVRDIERVLVTPAGSKDVHVANAEEWIKAKEQLAAQNPPAYNPQWVQSFRASYGLWKQGVAVPVEGTSIRSWAAASPSEIKRCIDANVLTVEDLAAANESTIGRLGMGARTLKDKAVAWIKERDGPGRVVQELEALKVSNAELARQNETMRQQLAEMAAKLADRPRKNARREPEPVDEGDVIR